MFAADAIEFQYPSLGQASGRAEWRLGPIDVEVQRGRMLGIIGPNGSGKSTLLRLLAGHERPLSGAIQLEGTELSSRTAKERARQLAYLPQRAEIPPHYTVTQLVLQGRIPWMGTFGIPRALDLQVVQGALESLGISELAEQRLDQISGGECQMALIASMIAQDVPCLLLDEPVASLDLSNQGELLSRLKTIIREANCGMALVLHDLTLAGAWCDDLLLISRGQRVASGPAKEVLTTDNLASAYGDRLGVFEDASLPHPVVLAHYSN